MSASPAPGALLHLPLPLFAVPMGIGGLGLAWREAARLLGAPGLIGEAILALTAALWLLIAVLHGVRALRHPAALTGDLRHPVRAGFAGAISIGLMIVAGGLIPYAPGFATLVWLGAVAFHLLVGVWTVRGLLQSPREAAVLVPPLLIPLVGNIVAPIFGVRLGFEALSWMLYGLGALLWVMIQPLILGRLIHGPALPLPLRPTLAILLAPPSVGAVALSVLTGGEGPLVLAVLGLAVLVALVLLSLAGEIARCPFGLPWWGLTFPSAAFSVALTGAAAVHGGSAGAALSWAVLAAVTALIAGIALATLRAALAGHLTRPEAPPPAAAA